MKSKRLSCGWWRRNPRSKSKENSVQILAQDRKSTNKENNSSIYVKFQEQGNFLNKDIGNLWRRKATWSEQNTAVCSKQFRASKSQETIAQAITGNEYLSNYCLHFPQFFDVIQVFPATPADKQPLSKNVFKCDNCST